MVNTIPVPVAAYPFTLLPSILLYCLLLHFGFYHFSLGFPENVDDHQQSTTSTLL